MTVGSYDKTTYQNGAYGSVEALKRVKTWSGADTAPVYNYPKEVLPAEMWSPRHAYLLEKLGTVPWPPDSPSSAWNSRIENILLPKSGEWEVYRRPYSLKTYRRPVKRLRNTWNAFEASGYTRRDSVYRDSIDGVNNTVLGDGSGSPILPAIFTDNDQLRLINKLREKAFGSDFNAGIFLAEGHKTLNMISGNAIKLAKAYHYARKGDVSAAAQVLMSRPDRSPIQNRKAAIDLSLRGKTIESSASLLLEWRYGVEPLVKDVQAGAQFLAHHLNVPQVKTLRASIRSKLPESTINKGGPGQIYWRERRVESRTLRVTWKENLSNIQGLGLLDPYPVLWEVTPWSFVADWFLPIGDWLAARGSAGLFPQGTFYESRLRKTESVAVLQKAAPYLHDWDPLFQEPASISAFAVSRLAATSALKVPLPSFKPLNKALSVVHCQNAIALLVGVITGKPMSRGNY